MIKRSAGGVLRALLPLLLLLGITLGAGGGVTFLQSLGILTPVPAEGGAGFSAYTALLGDAWFWRSFLLSSTAGLASALLSVAGGLTVALLFWRVSAPFPVLKLSYKIPLILPHIVAAFCVLILFGRSGMLSTLSHHLGLTATMQDFPDIAWGWTGVVLAYSLKGVSFTMLMVTGSLSRFDTRLLDTARMLGASPLRTALTVVLPAVRPAAEAAFVILAVYNFGGFDIPWLIGGSSPGMVSVHALNMYQNGSITSRPEVMAQLTVILLYAVAFVAAYSYISRKVSGEGRRI